MAPRRAEPGTQTHPDLPPRQRPLPRPVDSPSTHNASSESDRCLPPRPTPRGGLIGEILDHVRFVGFGPLFFAAAAVVLVSAGMWWLMRAPALPVEQELPLAAGSVPDATLATIVQPTGPTVTVVSSVVVHVAGSVADPGVFELASTDRVHDAVQRAGGPTNQADLDRVNLAAPLVDGQRVYIPAIGEEVEPAAELSSGGAPVVESDSGSGPVNINTADAAELEGLPGIGPATAAAIVEDRERNGPFAAVDELDRVSGIGPAKLEQLRGLVIT